MSGSNDTSRRDHAAALRTAARDLTSPAVAEDFGSPAIPPRLLASLGEQALAAEPRGLAYPEELKDIEHYLLAVAMQDCEESDHRLLATGAAWAAVYRGEEPEGLQLVRAVAAYFIRANAESLASFRAGEGAT